MSQDDMRRRLEKDEDKRVKVPERKREKKPPAKETAYTPIPVSAAREIAETYAKSIVIVLAHDPVHGLLHTTTYGVSPQDKAWAAIGGGIATRALGSDMGKAVEYEDYRLTQAKKLLKSLKQAIKIIEAETDVYWQPTMKVKRIVERVKKDVKEAERFIGV